MKKQILFALAFAALAVTGNAQRYYYRSAPWDGNKTYILNVGTDFNITPRDFGPNSSGLVTTPGLAASFRYEGDKEISKSLSWGYQVELSYLGQGIKYNEKLENNNIRYADYNWWELEFDVRLSFSYWPADNIELQAAAGVFVQPFTGFSGKIYETDAKGVEVPDSRKDNSGGTIFNFGTGISTMVQAKYFFTDEFFASFNIHDDISLSFFSKEFAENTLGKGGQRGVVMLGVGYKFFR